MLTQATFDMNIPIDVLLSQAMKVLLNKMAEKVNSDVSNHFYEADFDDFGTPAVYTW